MKDAYRKKIQRRRPSRSRVKEDIALDRAQVEKIVKKEFHATRLSGLDEMNAQGHYALVNRSGTKGYSIFYPDGTPESQNPIGIYSKAIRTYELMGRTIKARFVDQRQHIAGFEWKANQRENA